MTTFVLKVGFEFSCIFVDTLNYMFESLLGYKTIKMATKMGVKTIF